MIVLYKLSCHAELEEEKKSLRELLQHNPLSSLTVNYLNGRGKIK